MSLTSTHSRTVPFVVLGLIIGVHIIRQAWPDAVFFALALAASVEQSRRTTAPRHALRGPAPTALVVAGGAGCAVLLVLVGRHRVGTTVVVLALGLGAFLIAYLGGWPTGASPEGALTAHRVGQPRRSFVAHRRAVVAWGTLVVVAGLWELTAYLTWRFGLLADGVMPSISDILEPLLAARAGVVVFVALWLAGGITLAVHAWGPSAGEG